MYGLPKSPIGCKHYKRGCRIVAPCCKKTYSCRFCHNEAEDHEINRKEITEIICNYCNLKQYVQERCRKCNTQFAKYICLACNLFDDDTNKRQFHCINCGICRIGGRENFVHCKSCCMCLSNNTNHKCLENAGLVDCPVCLENIHESTKPVIAGTCGHYLHKACQADLINKGDKKCPLCRTPFSALN